jgi:hypothetical protein
MDKIIIEHIRNMLPATIDVLLDDFITSFTNLPTTHILVDDSVNDDLRLLWLTIVPHVLDPDHYPTRYTPYFVKLRVVVSRLVDILPQSSSSTTVRKACDPFRIQFLVEMSNGMCYARNHIRSLRTAEVDKYMQRQLHLLEDSILQVMDADVVCRQVSCIELYDIYIQKILRDDYY